VSDSGLDKTNIRTPEQAREEIARADRQGWYPARHGGGDFGVLARDGREVVRAHKEADRDSILMMARSHDAMKAALEAILPFAESAETKALVGDEGCLWPVEEVRAALDLVNGAKR
jgi:hypothetical protein